MVAQEGTNTFPNVSIQELKQLAAGPPVDYSFKDLKNVTELVYEDPVAGTASRPTLARESNAHEYVESLVSDRETHNPASPRSSGTNGAKLNSNAVRLCNNQLVSLTGLDRVLNHVLDSPENVVWLDLAGNQIVTVEDVLLKFPNLQVLYLHGNAITNVHDVLKLAQLSKLHKLTLHGNPIAEQKEYKMWVAAHLPALRNLDFSAITKVERDRINTWVRARAKKQSA